MTFEGHFNDEWKYVIDFQPDIFVLINQVEGFLHERNYLFNQDQIFI